MKIAARLFNIKQDEETANDSSAQESNTPASMAQRLRNKIDNATPAHPKFMMAGTVTTAIVGAATVGLGLVPLAFAASADGREEAERREDVVAYHGRDGNGRDADLFWRVEGRSDQGEVCEGGGMRLLLTCNIVRSHMFFPNILNRL